MKFNQSIIAGLLCATSCAMAAELELFGLRLADAPADQVRNAAISAGAKPMATRGPVTRLDASRLGLPGAQMLELTTARGKVMAAQYDFGKNSYQTDETLRKMLAAKYGLPKKTDAFGPHGGKFTDQFIDDGKYTWNFDRGMQLVYRKEFFGEVYLSYVNKPLLAEVEAAADATDKNTIKDKAERNKTVF